ncbi:hypothetical protein FHS89_000281 [Rubricella aquisinus]|uniref:DUF1178 family protein n=1 Tax=Rubricella aquisinus TaxID=2028108 RepID=A0A840WJB2_9RHOB|nr:DUF1178 family protein [Rubricella aquisinus]MBB5514283.1 hypothetical protein [Rubricella aquisinus]
MIRYALKCKDGHQFDSWFQDSATFDRLQSAGHVACAVCGVSSVEKAIMAPRVRTKEQDNAPALSAPAHPAEQALRALRTKVEAEADYVGDTFATEARRIHDGEAQDRPIWGEAKLADAKSLAEDGIPVVPLPFAPTRKTN